MNPTPHQVRRALQSIGFTKYEAWLIYFNDRPLAQYVWEWEPDLTEEEKAAIVSDFRWHRAGKRSWQERIERKQRMRELRIQLVAVAAWVIIFTSIYLAIATWAGWINWE